MQAKLAAEPVFEELAKRVAADPSVVKKVPGTQGPLSDRFVQVNGIYHFKIVAADKSTHSWGVDLKNGNGSVKVRPSPMNTKRGALPSCRPAHPPLLTALSPWPTLTLLTS